MKIEDKEYLRAAKKIWCGDECTIQNVSCCEFNLEQPKHIKEHIRFMDWVEYEKNKVLSSFAIPKNNFDK